MGEEAKKLAADQPVEPAPKRPADPLTSKLYDSLRSLANRLLSGHRSEDAVQATELVHECYLRLTRVEELERMDRTQFLALASTMIRNILVDQARREQALKRGSGWNRVTISDMDVASRRNEVDLIDLDQALERLGERDTLQARIIELHFFGGLKGVEIAALLNISRKRVHNEWLMARAWLYRELFGS